MPIVNSSSILRRPPPVRLLVTLSMILALIAAVAPSSIAQEGEESAVGFPDVPVASVHHDAVVELATRGVLLGRRDGSFGPQDPLTRAQFASIVARTAELEPVIPTAYSDVAGSPHEGAIGALSEAGVILGYNDGTFRPGAPIQRDHVALMLARWLELEPVADGPFTDVTRYAGEINALFELEVLRGTSATTFAPLRNVQRDQTASMIWNVLRPVHLRVLYVNDLHGALEPPSSSRGGAAYLAAYLDAYRGEVDNTLFLGGGDLIGGTPPISGLLRDEPTVAVLDALGMDASAVGNHEFDAGFAELQRLIDGGENPDSGEIWPGSDFTYLGANVIEDATGEPALPAAETLRVEGIPVAVLGLGLTGTPNIVVSGATEGLTFLDEVETANDHAAELADDGYRAIVLTAHLGGSSWAAGLDDEIDVVLGGHSHSRINTWVEDRLVLQAGSNGTTLGVVDLILDKRTRDVVEVEGELVWVDHEGVTPDPDIEAMVAGYAEQVEPIVNRVVGQTETGISRSRNDAGESPLGNLIADAQRAWTGTDLAFMNTGGIRADVGAGPITWGALFTVQPFGNTLTTMTMTGDQVRRVLEQQWDGGTGRLEISGFSYVWDSEAPAGSRVVEITDGDGDAVDPEGTYTVTVNVFLAGGGDSYTVFAEPDDQAVGGNSDVDALVAFIESLPQPVEYATDGRVTRLP